MFLIHQSVIDTIACILTIVQQILSTYSNTALPVICHLFGTKISSGMVLYVSTYNMIALTIERHSAITNPLHYDADKIRRRIPYVFTCTWIFASSMLLFVPVSTIIRNDKCLMAFKVKVTVIICFMHVNRQLYQMNIN